MKLVIKHNESSFKYHILLGVRGYCTSYSKINMFLLYLKIINTLFKNNVCIRSKLSKELKNGIEILVGQTVLKLWIKHSKYCLDQ